MASGGGSATGESQGDRILTQFKLFDQNGDGKIDRQELLTILQSSNAEMWTTARVDQVLAAADLNRDGVIMYEDFVKFVAQAGEDQGDFLKAAERVSEEAVDHIVRTLSNHSEQSGKCDLVSRLEELHDVPWETKEPAIALICRLLSNIVKDPTNPKFRRLKRSNPKLQEKLFSVPGCAELLMAAGFEVEGDELVLPDGQDVQWVLDEVTKFGSKEMLDHQREERDARIAAAKAEEASKKLKSHGVVGGSAEERKALLEKIEYDRQEREAREKLAAEGYRENVGIPAEKAGGAVTRFEDIGVDLNRGGG